MVGRTRQHQRQRCRVVLALSRRLLTQLEHFRQRNIGSHLETLHYDVWPADRVTQTIRHSEVWPDLPRVLTVHVVFLGLELTCARCTQRQKLTVVIEQEVTRVLREPADQCRNRILYADRRPGGRVGCERVDRSEERRGGKECRS